MTASLATRSFPRAILHNRRYATPATPWSGAGAGHDDEDASETESRGDLQRPRRHAGRLWHARRPMLSTPPAHRAPAAASWGAPHTPPPRPATPATPWLFAAGNAGATRARAQTAAATATRPPLFSPAVSGPRAGRRARPPATTSPPRRTGQRVACGPCPRLSSCPAMPAFRPTVPWPLSQRAPGVPRLLTSGVSRPKDTTDARSGREAQGGAERHGAHHPNASPRLHAPPRRPVPAGLQHRLDQPPDTWAGVPALDARPGGLVSDASRGPAHNA